MLPGDVIHIWLESRHLGGKDAKFKYLIRVDAKERWFLGINSDPHWRTEFNVPIAHAEATYLPNDVSIIDTSRLIGLDYSEFVDGMKKRGAGLKGSLGAACRTRLLENVSKSKILPKWQKDMIARNLAPSAPSS